MLPYSAVRCTLYWRLIIWQLAGILNRPLGGSWKNRPLAWLNSGLWCSYPDSLTTQDIIDYTLYYILMKQIYNTALFLFWSMSSKLYLLFIIYIMWIAHYVTLGVLIKLYNVAHKSTLKFLLLIIFCFTNWQFCFCFINGQFFYRWSSL